MFIDTNVLVYSRIPHSPFHDMARESLKRALQDQEPLSISRQVMREYLADITRPQAWHGVIELDDALSDVERLARSFRVLEDGPLVTESLIALCREVPVGGRQIHDANIVATMLVHGERMLLTFDRDDFLRYESRIHLVEY